MLLDNHFFKSIGSSHSPSLNIFQTRNRYAFLCFEHNACGVESCQFITNLELQDTVLKLRIILFFFCSSLLAFVAVPPMAVVVTTFANTNLLFKPGY